MISAKQAVEDTVPLFVEAEPEQHMKQGNSVASLPHCALCIVHFQATVGPMGNGSFTML